MAMMVSMTTLTKTSWSVAEAKARFSDVIQRALTQGPQIIQRYGRDAVVIISKSEWERRNKRKGTLAEFFAASPLRDSGVKINRIRGKLRDVEL